MNFSIPTKTFAEAVKIVSRANSGKLTENLGGVYLKIEDDGKLALMAGNDILSISRTEQAKNAEAGEVRIPGTHLFDIATRLAGDTLTFSYREPNGVASISAGASKFKLAVISGKPYFAKVSRAAEFEIDSENLINTIRKTAFAASRNDQKLIFNGCHIRMEKEGTLTFVATNTHRLSVRECSVQCQEECISKERAAEGVTVPAQALNEVAHVIKEDAGKIEVVIDRAHVAFYTPNTSIVTSVINGRFPDFRRVIPSVTKTTATIDKAKFLGMMDRMSVIAKNNNANDVVLEFKDGVVKCCSAHKEVGTGEETVEAAIAGEPIAISFNMQYLLDAMKVAEGDTFALEMSEQLRPAVIRDSDKGFTYVITPIRMKS